MNFNKNLLENKSLLLFKKNFFEMYFFSIMRKKIFWHVIFFFNCGQN